jgi:solute carrier family 45 protein 1/2/4
MQSDEQREIETNPLLSEQGSSVESPFVETVKPGTPKLSYFRLFALTICFLGVQFGWAIQIAFASPLFLELGLPKIWVSFVWLAGPISGLLVQPTVGVLSDRNTSRWGRRRPFIFIGGTFIVVAMLLISNASTIGEWLGDVGSHNPRAITLAIIGFWILDLANNTVQGPCRALLVDCAPAGQQQLGGSLFSFMLGFGNLAGYYTGSLPLAHMFPFFGTNLRALFTIAIINLVFCLGITLIFTKEKPLSKDEVQSKNPVLEILRGIRTMPKPMKRVCAVQFFTWVGWFTYILYVTTWVGENVFHGDPDAPPNSETRHRFEKGVQWASFGLSINAAICSIYSLVLPSLTRLVGTRAIYFSSQLMFSILLVSSIWIKTKIGAVVMIALLGIPWAVVMVIPFTLVALCVDESQSGLYMGVLNIFVVIPQILVSIGIGAILKIFGGNLAAALTTGGISAFISALLVFTLIIKTDLPLTSVTITAGGH